MRLFAAVELDLGITQRLVRLQQQFRIADRGVSWLSPAQMHLTLKFLGEVPDDTVHLVCEALREIAAATPAFEFDVAGVGCFPLAGPVRIVWAGLVDRSGVLAACQERCEDVFGELGFKRENRAFSPHLTIGRVKQAAVSARIRAALQSIGDFQGGAQGADEVVLFQSHLKREGAEYVPICRYELGQLKDDVAT